MKQFDYQSWYKGKVKKQKSKGNLCSATLPWLVFLKDFIIIFALFFLIAWGLFHVAYNERNNETFVSVSGEITGDYKIDYGWIQGELYPMEDGDQGTSLEASTEDMSMIFSMSSNAGSSSLHTHVNSATGKTNGTYRPYGKTLALHMNETHYDLLPANEDDRTSVDIHFLREQVKYSLYGRNVRITFRDDRQDTNQVNRISHNTSPHFDYPSDAPAEEINFIRVSYHNPYGFRNTGTFLEFSDAIIIKVDMYEDSGMDSGMEKESDHHMDEESAIIENDIPELHIDDSPHCLDGPLANISINNGDFIPADDITLQGIDIIELFTKKVQLPNTLTGTIVLENVKTQKILGSGEISVWQSSTPITTAFGRQSIELIADKELNTELIYGEDGTVKYRTEGYVKEANLESFSLKPSFSNWYSDNTMTLALSLIGLFGSTIATVGCLESYRKRMSRTQRDVCAHLWYTTDAKRNIFPN